MYVNEVYAKNLNNEFIVTIMLNSGDKINIVTEKVLLDIK